MAFKINSNKLRDTSQLAYTFDNLYKISEDNIMRNSILDGLAYQLLKTLSHSKNKRTNTQIAEEAEQETYDTYTSGLFLRYIGKYLDYKDKSEIDIGCGTGNLGIMLAKTGARKVVGIDLDQNRIASARKKAIAEGVEDIIDFECADFVKEYQTSNTFDVAFSKDAFEHILSPLDCLKKIYACLSEGGISGTIFGPLWASPYGAHMWGFAPFVPWIHFLFPEKVVLKVRTEYYRPDELIERYEDICGHLSRITVKKFRENVTQAGFEIQKLRANPPQDKGKYRLVNAMVNANPFLQELGSHQLLAILKKPESQ